MNQKTEQFKIDGESIYEPHLQIGETVESMLDDNSGVTDDGTMHVRWVRVEVHKFSLQYNLLSAAEYEEMKALLLGKTFTFTYPKDDTPTNLNCYCTSYGGTRTGMGYTGVSFEISEL